MIAKKNCHNFHSLFQFTRGFIYYFQFLLEKGFLNFFTFWEVANFQFTLGSTRSPCLAKSSNEHQSPMQCTQHNLAPAQGIIKVKGPMWPNTQVLRKNAHIGRPCDIHNCHIDEFRTILLS